VRRYGELGHGAVSLYLLSALWPSSAVEANVNVSDELPTPLPESFLLVKDKAAVLQDFFAKLAACRGGFLRH